MKPGKISLKDAKPGTKIIILHETMLHSWANDIGTFASVGILAWVNHAYLGGTWSIDALAVVTVLLKGLGTMRGYHVTTEELRAMLAEPSARSAGEAPVGRAVNT